MEGEQKDVAEPAEKAVKMHDRFFEELESGMKKMESLFAEAHEQLDTLLDFDVEVFDERDMASLEKRIKEFAEKHRNKRVRVGGFVLVSVKKE